MTNTSGGFVLYNPDANHYVRFDGAVIVFDTITEVGSFKHDFQNFFTGTATVPQVMAVEEEFIQNGVCVRYADISEELKVEAKEEVDEAYGG